MEIFTSRYANPELKSGKYTVVGITRGEPKFPLSYKLAGNIIEFAPPGYLFHENDRKIFTTKYFQHMDRIGVVKARELIKPYLQYHKPIVLCCYEDVRLPDEWCHRLVFAEWLYERTGVKVNELHDPSSPKGYVKPDEPVQLNLFNII